MNPIFKLVLKQLPVLIPVAKTLLKQVPTSTPPDNSRLSAVEHSVQMLTERSHSLETRLKRMRVLVLVTGLLSIVALVVVLIRS